MTSLLKGLIILLCLLVPVVLGDDRSVYRSIVCPALCPDCSEAECEPRAPGPIRQISAGRNGYLPDELGQLTFLENLSCDSCNLTGTIPDSLGSLPKLSTIWLNNNRLHGTIPASLFNSSSLHILSLPHNQLTGTLPSNLGLGATSLDELYLSHNMLTGNIPEGIVHMADTLYDLFLDHNQFSGPLNATTLGQLVNLDNLLLGNNQFEPPVPWSAIAAMQQLQRLDMSGMTTFAGLPLNGTALGAVALAELNLAGCGFEGPVPPEIANVGGSLFSLNLADNRLHSLPDLSALTGLSDFVLRNNSFRQRWPTSMSKMKSLGMVDFSHNQFYGELPFMPDLVNLGEFDASHNLLSGSFDFIGQHWENLGELRLNDNLLNGSLPESLASLRYLSVLHLAHNRFTGPVPTGLTVVDDVEPGQCNLFDSGANGTNCFECASFSDPANPCFIPECSTRVISCNSTQTVPNRFTAQSTVPQASSAAATASGGSSAGRATTVDLNGVTHHGTTDAVPSATTYSAVRPGTLPPSSVTDGAGSESATETPFFKAPSPEPAAGSPSSNMAPQQNATPPPHINQYSAVGPILGTLAVLVVLAACAMLFRRWRSTRSMHNFRMLGVGHGDMMPLEDDVQLVEEDQISETPPVRSSYSSGHRRKKRVGH